MFSHCCCNKKLCNEKLRELYDKGTSYRELNNDDLYNNQEKDTKTPNAQNYEESRMTFFLEAQKFHRESIENSPDYTCKEKLFDSDSEKGEGHINNVENMGENTQGKNNKELTDKNVSVQDPCLDGTVNQHIHSGGKGLYSYGMQNFDD